MGLGGGRGSTETNLQLYGMKLEVPRTFLSATSPPSLVGCSALEPFSARSKIMTVSDGLGGWLSDVLGGWLCVCSLQKMKGADP